MHAVVFNNRGERLSANAIDKKSLPQYISAFIACVGLCAVLIAYIILSGMKIDTWNCLALVLIVPAALAAVISFSVSAAKRTAYLILPFVVGLCVGMSWLFRFNIFLDASAFSLGGAFAAFIITFVALAPWYVFECIDCFKAVKARKLAVSVPDTGADSAEYPTLPKISRYIRFNKTPGIVMQDVLLFAMRRLRYSAKTAVP